MIVWTSSGEVIIWKRPPMEPCRGTSWPHSGRCRWCGATIGTSGLCTALFEIQPQPITERSTP